MTKKSMPPKDRKPKIRVAVIEPDPLRLVGCPPLFDTEPDFELVAATLQSVITEPQIDLALLGSHGTQNLFDLMAGHQVEQVLGTVTAQQGKIDLRLGDHALQSCRHQFEVRLSIKQGAES